MALFIGGGPHLKICNKKVIGCQCQGRWRAWRERGRGYLNIRCRWRAVGLNHFLGYEPDATLPSFWRLNMKFDINIQKH
jgi:hypothetical protein